MLHQMLVIASVRRNVRSYSRNGQRAEGTDNLFILFAFLVSFTLQTLMFGPGCTFLCYHDQSDCIKCFIAIDFRKGTFWRTEKDFEGIFDACFLSWHLMYGFFSLIGSMISRRS